MTIDFPPPKSPHDVARDDNVRDILFVQDSRDIDREPMRPAAAYWALWTLGSLYVPVAGDTRAWAIWLAAFLVVEIPASLIDTGKRDTLSECWTWLQRKLSKHRRFGRGWNAFVLLAIDVYASAGALPLYIDWRGIFLTIQAPIVFGLVVVWLWDHWVNPETNG